MPEASDALAIETAQRITRLEILVEAGQSDRRDMLAQLTRLAAEVADLNDLLQQAKGARVVLGMLIAVGSFLGGLVGYFGLKVGIGPH
jgi:hypothetical protein